MKKLMGFAVAFCWLVFGVVLTRAEEPKDETKLWAAVSVSKPLVHQDDAAYWGVYFTVVNDGDKTVDPEIGSSHLYINGKEPKDWNFVINNGLSNSYHHALPPGKFLLFNYSLKDRYFSEPGVYKVRWEGPNFKAAEISFRVMPKGS